MINRYVAIAGAVSWALAFACFAYFSDQLTQPETTDMFRSFIGVPIILSILPYAFLPFFFFYGMIIGLPWVSFTSGARMLWKHKYNMALGGIGLGGLSALYSLYLHLQSGG